MTTPPTPPGARPRSAIVVGGAGILAPAASELAGMGIPVSVVSRSEVGVPDGTESLRVDASSSEALSAVLDDRRWDVALVYSPTVSANSLAAIRSVSKRVIEVRVSAAADPALGGLATEPDVLQLGWTDGESGAMRWHSPDEVSAMALEVVADGRGRVLGRVRPWEERP